MPRVEVDTDVQGVPKPDGYEGNNDDAWVLTGQDGRLASEPGAGSFKTIDDIKAMRNLREVDKH